MKLLHRITTALPVLLFTLPAFGHNTGAIHDHGFGYLLLLAGLVMGIAAMLRR